MAAKEVICSGSMSILPLLSELGMPAQSATRYSHAVLFRVSKSVPEICVLTTISRSLELYENKPDTS